MNIDKTILENWANESSGPVALHLKQSLTSVECIDPDKDKCIVYPPTYADIGYNIDELADGTKVALVDSVGSQANRIEPIFICSEDDHSKWLVPQIRIKINNDITLSLLDLAHRGADAVVRSSRTLSTMIDGAFKELKRTGNAWPLGTIAPTSLLFGVWDSRGSNEKLPRLVRSVIRAWDVDELHAAAQFNSVWKGLDDEQQDTLDKEAKKQKVKLSVKGFADAPSIFRDTKVPQVANGAFNPGARVLGGVLVKRGIQRDLTVNLVALRTLQGANAEETKALQKYLLGLALLAATSDINLFLREGCHLRYIGEENWHAVPRRGNPEPVELASDASKKAIAEFADESAKPFRAKWQQAIGESMEFEFDLKLAKELLKKKTEEEQPSAG